MFGPRNKKQPHDFALVLPAGKSEYYYQLFDMISCVLYGYDDHFKYILSFWLKNHPPVSMISIYPSFDQMLESS